METQKGALLNLDRIKNERLLRFQKLQSLQVWDQNSCKQIRKVKAGICKIQKAHKLEADTNTNKTTKTNTIKTKLNTNTNSKSKSLPSCATNTSKTDKWQTALPFLFCTSEKRVILAVKLARLAMDNIKEEFVCSGFFAVQIRYTNEDTNIHVNKYMI